ncbi:hypothetical protein [Streptomyces sp. MNP-20]|uniref:hypothetical protein n=1 Tax=Streptomyces sp. MNP-20 TaxID=2721165 RepID=UPI00155545E2|nr:hypothetical protein [Streptomyces sp. MNP-20]
MKIAHRAAAGVLTTILLAGGMSFSAATPAAAASCKTSSKTYYLSEAKVPMRLGHVTLRVQVCENSKGKITSSRGWSEDSTTAPAKLLGWTVGIRGAYQSTSSNQLVRWTATGKAQTCLLGKIPLCSFAEDFEVTGTYYSSKFMGPTPTPKGKVSFKSKCTNKHCKLKFNKKK